MRSLFARTLLWFVATALLTISGVILISYLSFTSEDRRPPIGHLLSFQMREARYAWEAGGAEALARFLKRSGGSSRAEGILTDASGRDLLTGEDRSDLIADSRKRRRPSVFRLRPAAISRRSEDGRYWYVLVFPEGRLGIWRSLLLPSHLWVIGVVVLLSYGFALHLTSPLRQLQRAVERFGQGDLTARAGTGRKDEFGALSRTFDRMAGRIQTLLNAERRLLADISHELRSPLARLAVAVELARSGSDREAALNRIEKEADRLNALVGELLQITRAEGDPASLRRERVSLQELLGEVVDDCSIESQHRGSSIKLDAPDAVEVVADPELLRRAVENVVRNAIRFAPQDTAVEVALRQENGSAHVVVRDRGPGAPEEALPRLFDPFFRVETDRNRASGGAGLGLAIARRAVELHKGKIQARNAAPGLSVEIQLPAG
ncbi:MAG: ATP-binding protein [Bryobacteraceae bacterium]